MRFHHVVQAGLELLHSGDPLALASTSAGITGTNHHVLPSALLFLRSDVGSDVLLHFRVGVKRSHSMECSLKTLNGCLGGG